MPSDPMSNIQGAASDLFAGMAASTRAGLAASGLNIQAMGTRTQAAGTRQAAEGTRITAQGTRIGAEGVEINAQGMRIKAGGDIAEAENYDLAAGLARENAGYTAASTRIQQYQQQRQLTQAIGGQRAAQAAGGGAAGGSSMDVMRDSAAQGALAKNVLGTQGQITEAGFEEQAKSYETMSRAGRVAAAAEYDIANKTDVIAGQTRDIAGRQDLLAGRQDAIAAQQDEIAAKQDDLASATLTAGQQEATNDYISSAIKGVSAIAGLAVL